MYLRNHCTVHRQPAIVPIQILRVGQLVILSVPGELTTMAGRRLREAVHAQVGAAPPPCQRRAPPGAPPPPPFSHLD